MLLGNVSVGVLGSRSDSFSTMTPSVIWAFWGYSFTRGKWLRQSDRKLLQYWAEDMSSLCSCIFVCDEWPLTTFQRLFSSQFLKKRAFWLFSFCQVNISNISCHAVISALLGNFPWRSSILQNPIKPQTTQSLWLWKKVEAPPSTPTSPFASAATIINIGIPFFIWLSRLSETLPKWTFFLSKSIW